MTPLPTPDGPAKFLDPEPSGPFDVPPDLKAAPSEVDTDDGPTFGPRPAGMVGGENPPQPHSRAHETPAGAGPCADCAKAARILYFVGMGIGATAGVVAAYLILRNRLAPND